MIELTTQILCDDKGKEFDSDRIDIIESSDSDRPIVNSQKTELNLFFRSNSELDSHNMLDQNCMFANDVFKGSKFAEIN